jgi:hypothetical protein
VPESTEVGSVIYGVHARDGDSGLLGLVEYSLLDSPGSLFGLDRSGGGLRLQEALDYESVKRYRLIIGAQDKGVPPRVAQNFTLTVEVQDVNGKPETLPRLASFINGTLLTGINALSLSQTATPPSTRTST